MKRYQWSCSPAIFCCLRVGICCLILSGCGSDHNTAASTWCHATCSYDARCRSDITSDCDSECLEFNHDYFQNLNRDYLKKIAPCIEQASCSNNLDEIIRACNPTTIPTVVATEAVGAMCQEMLATFFDCFWQEADLATCILDFSPWADTAIARVSNCQRVQCDDLAACIDDALNGRDSL